MIGRQYGFFSRMNDRELLNYVFSLYKRNVRRGELYKKDSGLYNALYKRNLLDKISQVNPDRKKSGFFSKKTNEALLGYTFSLYGREITRSKLFKKDSS